MSRMAKAPKAAATLMSAFASLLRPAPTVVGEEITIWVYDGQMELTDWPVAAQETL